MTLIALDVVDNDGARVPMTAEHATEHFAIAPKLTKLDDGTYGLDTRQALIHRPTGLAMPHTGDACQDLRRLATALEALDIDWSASEFKLTTEQGKAYLAAVADAAEDHRFDVVL